MKKYNIFDLYIFANYIYANIISYFIDLKINQILK
jgi:hypothetical protein